MVEIAKYAHLILIRFSMNSFALEGSPLGESFGVNGKSKEDEHVREIGECREQGLDALS